MNEIQHNAIKIKEAAQATVHAKISSLNQKDLLKYFASRKTGFPKAAASQTKRALVCEPPCEYPKKVD
jgi:hypothetical protein